MAPPNIIYGSAAWTFDEYTENAEKVHRVLEELGIREIDTAPIYPVKQPQQCEKMIGEWGFGASDHLRLRIDSKILFFGNGDGTLTPEAIQKSLDQSLVNVKLKKLYILYCHGPDRATPLAEQAAALDAEYRKGKFEKLGVSNWPVEMLQEFLHICEEKGYVKPSVFQGQYNLLCRTYEKELFPLLRKHKLTFTAFSPLAGGFLTGKLTFADNNEDLKGTRFEANETNYMGQAYRYWYDKPSMHAAMREMKEACKGHDVDVDDAASRWILFHSSLDGGPLLNWSKGDSVIIGPRTFDQLDWFSQSYIRGPLPKELVDRLDRLWDGVKEDAASIIVY